MPVRRARTVEEAFGAVLRELRKSKGLSQERLGYDADSGRTYISQLERGERGPSLKMVFRLAESLGIAPSEIVARVATLLRNR
ncbi:MAG: helix-turn-helix domain-containing protein [Actinomycetota bacterium]